MAYRNLRDIIIDVDYWRNKDPKFPEDVLVWFTKGFRTDSGMGASIHGIRPNRSLSFPLGKFASVFQTEIYAII